MMFISKQLKNQLVQYDAILAEGKQIFLSQNAYDEIVRINENKNV